MDEQEGLKGKLAYEVRRGNIVAAVFDDGESGPLWCVGCGAWWEYDGLPMPCL